MCILIEKVKHLMERKTFHIHKVKEQNKAEGAKKNSIKSKSYNGPQKEEITKQ